MTSDKRSSGSPLVKLSLVALGAALATVLLLLLYANISTRKQESKQTFLPLVELDETTVDPAIWGKNFPRQYDSYQRTAERTGTRFGGWGSETLPDSRIEEDPRLKTIFAGYAFAIDFRERRGHAYMLEDQRTTKRVTERKQPGACVHCHASNTVAFREEGIRRGAPGALGDPFLSETAQAQLMAGFEAVCAMPYAEATQLVEHPVACIDCHDPRTMQLRVTKPGFIRGIRALAESEDPLPHLPSIEKWRAGDRSAPYEANREASRQEMRSMVCGQCHVEYYCGPKETLFFPWDRGLKVEQIEATYDAHRFPDGSSFADWEHAATGAPVLKAQHPEFELWSQGVHARSGVACADCHMPYLREGAIKISDHHVRSPLLSIARACQTCHRFPEQELAARVATIQERNFALMHRAEDAIVALIEELAAARQAGVAAERLAAALAMQRRAQWRVDFINAENSMGFHAPQEAARILAEAIDYSRQGQMLLRELAGGGARER